MTSILTAAEGANFIRTESTDAVLLMLLPMVDKFIQRATGRDWTADATIHPVAKAAAGILLVLWYDNPAQVGSESMLPFGLFNVLGQLEAEALKYRKYTFWGVSGAGSVPLSGALAGDDVLSLVGVYGVTGSQITKFESKISVQGFIQQVSATDLSANLYVAILKSPADDVGA